MSRKVTVAAAILVASLAPARAADRAAIIDDLVVANHILYRQGVLDGFGHVSVRDPANPTHFLMSSARAPGRGSADDIMEFDLDAKPVDGRGRPIYSERFIHAEIYRARADVQSVVHSHSPTVIPFSVTQVALKPLATTASFLAAGVPVFEIRSVAGMSNMLVNDRARGHALAASLGQSAVVLLRGHGDAVVGPDVRTVVSRAIYTEIDARLELQALALGGPITYIAPEEAAASEEGRKANGPGSEHGTDRTWEMWKEDAQRGGPGR